MAKEQKKIKDKEIQTNGFEEREKDFQDNVEERGYVYELLHKLAQESSEKAFEDKGIERVEGYAGVYGNGKTYGKGVQEGKYDVTCTDKVKSIIQKFVNFGTKRIETEIYSNLDADNNLLEINYDGTERAVFRGHMDNDDPMGFMINDKITVGTKDKKKLEKELKKFFDNCAKKEVNYLLTTKIGIDDKLEKSMDGSIVENANNKKMGLNDLLNSSPEDISNFFENKINEAIEKGFDNIDSKGEKIDKEEYFDQEVDGEEDLNNKDVIDYNTQGKLLFDDELNENNVYEYKALMNHFCEGKEFKELSRKEKAEVILKCESVWSNESSKEELLSEIATGGVPLSPGTAGPFRYATYVEVSNERMEAFKDMDSLIPFEQRVDYLQESEELDEMTTAGADGAGAGAYQSPYMFKKFEDTNYAKAKKKRPQVKKAKNEGDSFWTTVDVEDLSSTHTLGMPGVEPGSKEEEELTKRGGVGAAGTQFIKKLEENASKKVRLVRKDILSESHNTEDGINKRYLVTEKLNEDDMRSRWSELSTFISESTIEKEALTDEEREIYNEVCGCGHDDSDEYETVDREESDDIMNDEFEDNNSEEFMDIEKPNSFVVLKVSKADFLSENKFIKDYKTGNYVLHPKFDKVGYISENRKSFNINTGKFE